MWLYYWGFTERQVDLLLIDQPVIVYDHDKKKSGKGGKKGKNAQPEFKQLSDVDVLEKQAEWTRTHADGKSKVDTGFLQAFKDS